MFILRKITKILCLTLSVIFVITAFSGCKGENGGGSAEISSNSAELDEILNSIPEELKGTTIKYFTWYPIEETPEYAVIKDFEKKTGIRVELERGSYDNFSTELNTKISTSNSPDLIVSLNPTVYNAKQLTPLTEIDYDFTDKAWDSQTMKDYSFGGKPYATNLVNTSAYDPVAIVYNEEAFEENDIELPYDLYKKGEWTWSKFEEICESYANISDGNYGASFCPLYVYTMSHGVDLVGYDGTVYKSNLDNPLLSSAWRTTLEWFNRGLVSSEVFQMGDFMSGKCGLFFVSIRHTRIFPSGAKEEYFRRFKSKGTLGVAPIPLHDDKNLTNYQPLIEYSAYGIPKGANNPNAVPYFLRYLLDEKNYPDVWPDKETEELYKEMRANPNRTSMPEAIIPEDSGMDAGVIIYRIKKTDPQQITTTLMTWSGVVNDAVTKANSEIENLDK